MSKILNVFPSTVFVRARWPGWLFTLGSWITKQLMQTYHHNGMVSRKVL